LTGGSGSDMLLGGAGDDSLEGGTGGDRILGEAGADTIDARDNEVDTVASSGNGTAPEPGDTLLTDPVDVINEAFILFPSWADGLP